MHKKRGGSALRILKNNDHIKNDILKASQKEILNDYAHHGHEFFEMEFIIEGEGVYEIDGREYRIAPNTLFFMNPTNVHAIRAARASIINIMFTHDPKGDAADIGTLLLSQPPCFILDDQTNDFLRVVFSEIVRVYKRNAKYAMTLLRCAVYRLAGEYGVQGGMSHTSSYVRRAIMFIHENFALDIGLSVTASHVGLTDSYFSELFHRELGVTFKSYLDDIRFSYAKKLLKYTALSVKEIYFRSGFCDYANFARRFKERYGMTPTAYRAAENEF